MKIKIILLTCLLLVGCQSKENPNTSTAPTPKKSMLQRFGFGGPTPEEQELHAQQLKDGDALVAKWADKMQEMATKDGFGFQKMEGLTEADPWGQQIRLSYHQKWFDEIATIQSAGPDGIFDTIDDLKRVRSAKNPAGIIDGISGLGWVVIAWLFCGGAALAFSSGIGYRRVAKGKSRNHRRPIAFALTTIIFAPLAMFIYGLQFIGGALGATGEFFDGFDFYFDIDL